MLKKIFIITLLVFSCLAESVARERGTTEIDGLYSNILSEQRDLLIKLPNSYHQNKQLSYPVLYLPDGLRNFLHVSGTLDLLAQSHQSYEMIIVAIKNTHRTRDFTPTYDESYNQWGVSGGADNFLDFIEQELKPYIDKKYRTSGFDILSGHSLGGLLAVYSLQTRPHLFQAHFAFSPSLWWHDKVIFEKAKAFYANDNALNNYLYINLANEGGHMRTSFESYKSLLEQNSRTGFTFTIDLITDENHSTSAMVGHNKAFTRLYESLKCPTDVASLGLMEIERCYATLSKTYGAQINADYHTLAQAAGAPYNDKRYDDAIHIYQQLLSKFPHLSDPHYRMAHIYHSQGKLDKALTSIDKALTISIKENVENNKYKQFKAFVLEKVKKKP